MAGEHAFAGLCFLDGDLAQPVQPRRERVGECFRHVLRDEDAGRIRGHRGEHFLDRFRASRGGPDHYELLTRRMRKGLGLARACARHPLQRNTRLVHAAARARS
jgi:hypothetical protein